MPIFVIHRHQASHLHWDLRLEMDKTLKSWAIPKEPPRESGLKRLAVQVEDHPLSYADFHGTIPEGSYGAGKVTIWDKGDYSLKSRKENKLLIELRGKKMKGEYILLRFTDEKKNWLMFRK